jgi:colanic acid biosynthesis glycosyl transferase WcaI
LNILAVTQYFPPDLGGASTRASNLVNGLSLNGCSVTVIAAFPHYPHGRIPQQYRWLPIKIERIGKIRVIRTYMPPIASKGLFKRILLMVSFAISALFALPWVGKIDAIWAQSWVPSIIYGKLKRVPVALNVDDLTIEDLHDLGILKENSIPSKIASNIYRIFYVKGNAVTPISPGYVSTISRKYCVDINKIHVIRIGVNLATFKSRESSDKGIGKFKVVYAGVLGLGYDFEQIFKAASILEQMGEDVEFVLHGQGECLPTVRNRINELNCRNIVLSDKFFPSKQGIVNLLNSADALILPMKDYGRPYLGLPTKLYEYQAMGKPIICCCSGVPSKYISMTNSGLIVSPGDYKALANAVLTLKRDFKTAQMLGANGRRHVESSETVESISLEMKKTLNSIINSGIEENK